MKISDKQSVIKTLNKGKKDLPEDGTEITDDCRMIYLFCTWNV